MHKLTVPTINNNDTAARLIEWYVEEGAVVKKDDLIAELETSKATFDFLAPADGILHKIVQVDDDCDFGLEIGCLFENEEEKDKFQEEALTSNTSKIIITKAAKKLLTKHGISEEKILNLKKQVIKKTDVEKLLKVSDIEQLTESSLSTHQLAVATVVSHAHATIPQSFVLMKVYIDEGLAYIKNIASESKKMIGLPELVVQVVSNLREKYPKFFSALDENLRFTPSVAGNIGVTIDIGKELFIPSVKEAHTKTLPEIASILMSFRAKALRHSFTTEELEGGDITISINMEEDVLLVTPIILPPQTCMITIGSICSELFMEEEQQVKQRKFINIGLAYDHRIINGSDAVTFLKELKIGLETKRE